MNKKPDALTSEKLDEAVRLLNSFRASTPPVLLINESWEPWQRFIAEKIVGLHEGSVNVYHCSPTGRLFLYRPYLRPCRPMFGFPYGMSLKGLHNALLQNSVKAQVESWENEGGSCEKDL